MQNPVQKEKNPLRIRLFGTFCILDTGGGAISLRGRKDRALGAYLAAHLGTPVARDRLVELIWPGAAEGAGRSSLRQSLSTLRKALPEPSRPGIRADRDTVELDPAFFETDQQLLRKAAAAPGTLDASLADFDGAFLEDLGGISGEFDSWRSAEQTRVAALAVNALSAAADQAGHGADALSLLARVAALDPLAEPPARRLMQAYAAQGKPEAALRHYRSLEVLLETELGVRPEPETRDLARDIRAGKHKPDPIEPPREHAAPPTRPAILIAPFVETPQSDDYFAASFTESIILALARFPETPVFDLKTVKAASAAHDEDPLDMARAIGAAYVLSGSIRRGAGRLRVNVRLTEAKTGRTAWADRFDRAFSDLLDLEDELSAQVATTVAGRIEDEAQRRARGKEPTDLDVIDLIMRGRYHLNQYTQQGETEAKRCFEEALRRDPDCVAALAGLAVSHIHDFESATPDASQDKLETAKALAERAIALDEYDAHARYAMASSMCYLGGHDMALQHCNRALETNPNDYHNICTLGWILTFRGDIAEGIACNSRAITLNPYAPNGCLMTSGFGMIVQGRTDDAIKILSAIRGENMFKQGALAACYHMSGREREAELAAQAFHSLAEADFPGDGATGFRQTSAYWRRLFRFAKPQDETRFFSALNDAGVPV